MSEGRAELEKRRELWTRETELIRAFVERRPSFEQLASEVAYTLEKRLRDKGVEFSAVTYRAKTLDSFIDKFARKKYKNPLMDISDLAGVRVVYLYASDFPKIDTIVRREFTILEVVDKLAAQGDEKFGYGAIHYIVNLGGHSSGARYDDLKDLRCEIQVRTVLQDAWSIISHHLIYKNEKDVPTALRRRFNSLAGLLETGDDQFDRLRSERLSYLKSVEEALDSPEDFLGEEANIDTVTAYLGRKFPSMPLELTANHLSIVFAADFPWGHYKTLRDIEDLLDRTGDARAKYRDLVESKETSSVGELAVAVALDYPPYREEGWAEENIELFKEVQPLVRRRKKLT